jgi:hypothetical protein
LSHSPPKNIIQKIRNYPDYIHFIGSINDSLKSNLGTYLDNVSKNFKFKKDKIIQLNRIQSTCKDLTEELKRDFEETISGSLQSINDDDEENM